ncbi:MAG: glycosyltransferase [candidate division WOR-3 bacterium]
MRIGVNLLPFRQRLAGTGRFTQNILAQLAALDQKNNYFLFLTKQSEHNFTISAPNFLKIICPFSPNRRVIRIFWEQFILPWQLLYYRIDLLFTPSVAIPFLVPTKTVTVIHDMIPFHRSITKYTPLRSFYIQTMTKWAVKRSDTVIAVSENTKREIVRFCSVPQSKIFVALEGVSPQYHKIDSESELKKIRAKYNLPDRFILFVGTQEPGKNLPRLIEAFFVAKKINSIPHKLVIVGAYGWGKKLGKTLPASIANTFLSNEVFFPGYIQEEDLPLIYNQSELFVFPSLYEGFGLPVLEAMACGVPVICSNLSSLPEIAGDAAILVNPYNTSEIADAIVKVLNDNTLQAEMIRKGFAQVKKFNWQQCANAILNTFKFTMGNHRPNSEFRIENSKYPPDLSIIIITYNAANFLVNCLNSIYRNTKKSFEVIVVENGSTDNTLALLAQFPQIRIIKNRYNRGVARARNQGLRVARGRYLVLLDVDTTIIGDALDRLVEFMDKNPKVGICGPKLLSPNQELQFSCRKLPSLLTKIMRRLPFKFVQNHLNEELMCDWNHNSIRPVDYVIGACQIIRRAAYEAVGFLDGHIFYGPEDIDYCIRTWQKGFQVFYYPDALIIHHEQRITKKKFFSKLTLHHIKGLIYYFIKYRYLINPARLKKRLHLD